MYKKLISRKQELISLKAKISAEKARLKKGKIGVRKAGKYWRFYLCGLNSGAGQSGYLGKKDEKTIQSLIQREYDEELIEKIKKEISFIEEYEKIVIEEPWISTANEMHEVKQKYIHIPVISDEEYKKDWLNQTYIGKGFLETDPEYYTEHDVRVRSKSELIIGNALEKLNIPFHYEKPFMTKNGRTVYPDFTILDVRKRKEYIWEHVGLLDDLGYRSDFMMKLRSFEESGIYVGDRLILTFERNRALLNTKTIESMIKAIFMEDLSYTWI